jgi:hypothetical protein
MMCLHLSLLHKESKQFSDAARIFFFLATASDDIFLLQQVFDHFPGPIVLCEPGLFLNVLVLIALLPPLRL